MLATETTGKVQRPKGLSCDPFQEACVDERQGGGRQWQEIGLQRGKETVMSMDAVRQCAEASLLMC